MKRAVFLVECMIVGAMCIGSFGMAFWNAGMKLLTLVR